MHLDPPKGKGWDNPCSETLFGSLKTECLHGQRLQTKREAKDEIIDWLLQCTRARLHSTPAYVSPIRFEQHWRANQPRQANPCDQPWDTDSRGKVNS
ncbi:IS3 family transposase [Variovorax paradoxus]|uniref:IS3 family transposase n=1 Tax=Variovorax paradoxus TaxID=34073 RepID=UPI001931CFFA|nr:IS3 family transposase [Variovorax paradoxus]